MSWLEGNKHLYYTRKAAFLLLPVAFYVIPFAWINSKHTLCIYKNITGHNCYGCGTTRALWCVLHFHFADAWGWNKLVIIVAPLLVYLWVKEVFFRKQRKKN